MKSWALGVGVAVAVLLAAPGEHVQVDASEMETGADELAGDLREQLDAVLIQEELDPASLRVAITWLDADNLHYAIKATFDEDLPAGQLPVVGTCKKCTRTKVVTQAIASVRELIPAEKERLAAAETVVEETDTDDAGAEDTVVDAADDTSDDTGPAPREPLRAMGWSGVGLLAAGGAAAITGGVFLGLGERRPAADMSQIRDFRPTGYVLLGSGVAMIIVGAILLGVDRSRAKRGATKRGSKATAWLPRPWLQRTPTVADGDRRR